MIGTVGSLSRIAFDTAIAEHNCGPPITVTPTAATDPSPMARKAVDALAERDRLALLMREEGLDYNEIAEALELSPGCLTSGSAPLNGSVMIVPTIARKNESPTPSVRLICTGAQSCTARRAIKPCFRRTLVETGGATRCTLSETERTIIEDCARLGGCEFFSFPNPLYYIG